MATGSTLRLERMQQLLVVAIGTDATGIGTPPTDYTKPQQTIQSPGILDKAPETLYKALNIRQRSKILDKTLQY